MTRSTGPAAPGATRRRSDTVPDRDATASLARDHDVVPLRRALLLDDLGPTTAFARLCPAADDEPGFLLEGAVADGGATRFSYVGHRPRLLDPADDPLEPVRDLVDESVADVAGLPPFPGGAVGYLGYEAARHFERVPTAAGAAPDLPESAWLRVDDLVVFDHATREVHLLVLHRPALEDYDAAVDRLDVMQRRLVEPVEPPRPDRAGEAPDPTAWRSNLSEDEFHDRVRRAQEYIAAGEAFQIVLSQRFTRPTRVSPLELYRHLRAINPSPYLFLVSLGAGRHVVGASPELLVTSDGERVSTRPLAGTRPRGVDRDHDRALEVELGADAKERAEHVMLVDLGRHDIGRVAAPGTVVVDALMEVERFSHVMHLSSTVTGLLAGERSGLDAVRSTFPAGTLSGAPKIRAMEIIAELEPERRGVYGGALGTVAVGGRVDLGIVLRTLVVSDGRVHAQAGAGIVADSDPAAEYAETLNKAGALFAAADAAEVTP